MDDRIDVRHRIRLYKRQSPVKGRAVVGLDIGTVNFAAARVVRCEETGKCLCTHIAILNIEGENKSQTVDAVGNMILPVLLTPSLKWIWFGEKGKKHYITVERQMDQLHQTLAKQAAANGGDMGASDKKKKEKPENKAKYKPPIMFAIYAMLRMISAAIQNPAAFISDEVFDELCTPDIITRITPSEMGNPNLVFVPRSGSQKLGLSGLHGDNRKTGSAIEVAIMYMEEEGDDDAAAFMETLERVKPLQDANDAYLQARHYLHELEEEDRKTDKREAAAKKKQEKPIKTTLKNNKRKAEVSDEEDTDELLPAKKKARTIKE